MGRLVKMKNKIMLKILMGRSSESACKSFDQPTTHGNFVSLRLVINSLRTRRSNQDV